MCMYKGCHVCQSPVDIPDVVSRRLRPSDHSTTAVRTFTKREILQALTKALHLLLTPAPASTATICYYESKHPSCKLPIETLLFMVIAKLSNIPFPDINHPIPNPPLAAAAVPKPLDCSPPHDNDINHNIIHFSTRQCREQSRSFLPSPNFIDYSVVLYSVVE